MWCGAGGLPQARVMRAPRRSFAKLLVTLPPDAVVVIYAYFAALLYVSAAVLWYMYARAGAAAPPAAAAAEGAPAAAGLAQEQASALLSPDGEGPLSRWLWWPVAQVAGRLLQLQGVVRYGNQFF